ncbi:MAG: hypothetical protein GY839_12320 [candidate division Zixibacteria bacterium]|nr:hypothetical protein [candidate division Zixibacteria bacterium]
MKRASIISIALIVFMLGCGKKATNDDPPDLDPPTVTNLSRVPEEPMRNESIIISATVIDSSSGLASVGFYYSILNNFFPLDTFNEADSFYAIVPELDWGRRLRYFVQALDSAGNEAVSDTALYYIPNFEIYINPATDTIAIGEQGLFSVNLDGAEDVFSISMDLIFDTTIVMVDTVMLAEPNLLGDDNVLLLYQAIPGGVSVGIGRVQTEENDNVWGCGQLFKIVFSGLAPGTASIEIADGMIRTDEGVPIDIIEDLYLLGATLIID